MVRFLVRRILGLLGVLLVMSFIVFVLQSVIPADPARALAGPNAPNEVIEGLREDLGLNDPVLVQYGRYLGRVVQGNLGTSVRTRQPVAADIATYAPASLELMLAALTVGIALGTGVAVLQHLTRAGGPLRVILLALGSVPIFLSALLLVYLLWFQLDWLPGGSRIGLRRFQGPTGFMLIDWALVDRPEVLWSALRHLVLPAMTLALPIAVALARSIGSSLGTTMQQPFIRTVRGKGLSEGQVLWRHAARNSAAGPLAMLGLQVGLLFANLLIVERIFAWPGLGLYTVQAFASSDLPAVLGVSLAFGAFYIAVNILIDLGQAALDPRVRLA
ncbi:MAG TPA: ABC transporter permease [Rubellimicrobium sp.]|jgi:peptide/nickel transport system permease protein/dipeptide transport system permease protein|nr:ABC transporter permease [Rubellimicrobium sp.]